MKPSASASVPPVMRGGRRAVWPQARSEEDGVWVHTPTTSDKACGHTALRPPVASFGDRHDFVGQYNYQGMAPRAAGQTHMHRAHLQVHGPAVADLRFAGSEHPLHHGQVLVAGVDTLRVELGWGRIGREDIATVALLLVGQSGSRCGAPRSLRRRRSGSRYGDSDRRPCGSDWPSLRCPGYCRQIPPSTAVGVGRCTAAR